MLYNINTALKIMDITAIAGLLLYMLANRSTWRKKTNTRSRDKWLAAKSLALFIAALSPLNFVAAEKPFLSWWLIIVSAMCSAVAGLYLYSLYEFNTQNRNKQ